MGTLDTFQTLKLVPLYEGQEKELNNFINIVEAIGDTLKDDEERKKFLQLVFKTKINENIRIKIGATNIINKIEDFKKIFAKHFQKKINPLKIQNDMTRTRQGELTVQTFASKIEALVTLLNTVQIAENDTSSSETIRKLNYKTALNAFQAGLSEPFRTAVFAAVPESLEKAVEIATQMEAVNDVQHKTHYVNACRGCHSYRRNTVTRNMNNNNFRNNYRGYNNTFQNNQYTNRNNNFNNRNYTGRIQQQRYPSQQRYPTQQRNSTQNHNTRRFETNYFRYRGQYKGNTNMRSRNINVLHAGNEDTVPEAHHSRDEELDQ